MARMCEGCGAAGKSEESPVTAETETDGDRDRRLSRGGLGICVAMTAGAGEGRGWKAVIGEVAADDWLGTTVTERVLR